MNADSYSCQVPSQDDELYHNHLVTFAFGDSPVSFHETAAPLPSVSVPSEKEVTNGSTSSETKTTWDEVLNDYHLKEEHQWIDLDSLHNPWGIVTSCDATNSAWDNALIESLNGHGGHPGLIKVKSEDSHTSDMHHTGISDLECADTASSNLENHLSTPPPSATNASSRLGTTLINGSVHDDEFVTLYHTEMEFQELMASATDPVGKFLKSTKLTAQQAVQLNIQDKLLAAPKTVRQKYGKRKYVSKEERYQIQKERNKLHARATRSRRKIFKEVMKIQQEAGSKSSQQS